MWHKEGAVIARAFKQKPAAVLFEDYLSRLAHYTSCGILGGKRVLQETPLWLCHPGRKVQPVSSEDIAKRLSQLERDGVKQLTIAIGGADGFSETLIQTVKPAFVWSFGPMTLPHELAAVVAAEQIYRAWTILKKHPYHLGH